MADDQDQSQRTEEPSQKKLDEALKKGEVAMSHEVRHFFVLMAVALAITISGQRVLTGFREIFKTMIEKSYSYPVDGGHLISLFGELLSDSASLLVVPALILMIGAVAGSMIQHKPVWSLERLKPDLSKISPLGGFKRLFSAQNVVEFVKSLLKILVVGAVVFFLVWPERDRLPDMVSYKIDDIAGLIERITMRMLIGVIAIMAAIAAGDYLFQHLNFRGKLRMT